MKNYLIPLLALTALLGGCQHVAVRHSIHLPVVVSEHTRVDTGVVVVHGHDDGYYSGPRHRRYEPRRVEVVAPRPVIHPTTVTVVRPDRYRRSPAVVHLPDEPYSRRRPDNRGPYGGVSHAHRSPPRQEEGHHDRRHPSPTATGHQGRPPHDGADQHRPQRGERGQHRPAQRERERAENTEATHTRVKGKSRGHNERGREESDRRHPPSDGGEHREARNRH